MERFLNLVFILVGMKHPTVLYRYTIIALMDGVMEGIERGHIIWEAS